MTSQLRRQQTYGMNGSNENITKQALDRETISCLQFELQVDLVLRLN